MPNEVLRRISSKYIIIKQQMELSNGWLLLILRKSLSWEKQSNIDKLLSDYVLKVLFNKNTFNISL